MANDASGEMPPVMILCGGRGTRLREVTEQLPEPMVPIVRHIMKSYAARGVRRFILCLEYKRESFIDPFVNNHMRTSDTTITLGHEHSIRIHDENDESDGEVTPAGTGLNTMTGERMFRTAQNLRDKDENFFLIYDDGVSDIDPATLYHHHLASDKLLTRPAVHPESRFGEMIIDGDDVIGFEENPAQMSGYISTGFMVVNRKFLVCHLKSDEELFSEREPLRRYTVDGKMQIYRHEGFWQCMDNPRKYALLNTLWESGNASWTKSWK